MGKRSLPLKRVYGLLEPGPVVLVTTLGTRGRPNAMTQSWHLPLEFEPPLVGMVVSDQSFSHAALVDTRECVLNIPTVDLKEAVVGCGNTSGRRTDKFERFGLTAGEARLVRPPLVRECYANLECRVIDTTLERKYAFWVVEVVFAWIDPSVRNPRTLHHRGNGRFMVAGRSIQTNSNAR